MQPQSPYQPQQPDFQGPDGALQPQDGPAPDIHPVDNVNRYPVDYLNQIATPIPVKKASPMAVAVTIIGILSITGILLFVLIQAFSPPSVGAQLYALQARLETLNTVTTSTGKRLTQNNLSNINSTLGSNLRSMKDNLKKYMDDKSYKSGELSLQAKKTEATYASKLTQELEDAYLTGTLDRSYSGEIAYQITALKSKLQKLKATTNSKAFNEFYEQNVASLDAATEQLNKFQNTK